MTEINKKLCSSLLPAPMIIKNYVAGDENCNYEKYLLEMLYGGIPLVVLREGANEKAAVLQNLFDEIFRLL